MLIIIIYLLIIFFPLILRRSYGVQRGLRLLQVTRRFYSIIQMKTLKIHAICS